MAQTTLAPDFAPLHPAYRSSRSLLQTLDTELINGTDDFDGKLYHAFPQVLKRQVRYKWAGLTSCSFFKNLTVTQRWLGVSLASGQF
jgi:hypothetical protein